jgi:hypothetical protein
MRRFTDESGETWEADVLEERVARHHGRWVLLFKQPSGVTLPMPEVRWQTRASAERILRTMSDFELRRRLKNVRARYASNDGPSDFEGQVRVPRRLSDVSSL